MHINVTIALLGFLGGLAEIIRSFRERVTCFELP